MTSPVPPTDPLEVRCGFCEHKLRKRVVWLTNRSSWIWVNHAQGCPRRGRLSVEAVQQPRGAMVSELFEGDA